MSKKAPGLLLALLSGAVTALAFPKFSFSVLAWISLVPLFYVLSQCRPKQAFWNGLAAGVAFYGVLLYWIPDVPAHYGDLPMWLSIIIYLILILFLAGYWALFSLSFAVVRQAFPAAAYLLAPFLWVSFEYAMTYVLTGFPWGVLGYSQSGDIPFLQLASLTGVYGLSFVLIFLQSAFVLAMKLRKRAPFVAAVSLLAIVHAAGWMSLEKVVPSKDSFTASVIQGNVSSDIAWDMISGEETTKIFNDHLDLTRQAYDNGARLIIWPEFTVPLCFSCPEGIPALQRRALQVRPGKPVHPPPRDQRDVRPPGKPRLFQYGPVPPPRPLYDPIRQDAPRPIRRIHPLQKDLLLHRQSDPRHRRHRAGKEIRPPRTCRPQVRLPHLLRGHLPRSRPAVREKRG